MKIKKLSLSDEVTLAVAEDIASSFTIPKYEQFLTKHSLLSYNPNEYSYFNKIDFIRATLEEIDERLFLELDNKGVLSDETKSVLIDCEVEFKKSPEPLPDTTATKKTEHQPTPVLTKSSNNDVSPAKADVASSVTSHQSSLLKYVFTFFFVLILSGILWNLFPNYAVFILLISTSIIVFLAISVISLKHENKISDNTFVNVIGKIAEMVKSLARK